MTHYILLKFNDKVVNEKKIISDITALFEKAKTISGVTAVKISPCVVSRPNRYDLMIKITFGLDAALEAFDQSSVHSDFKKDFGPFIGSKVIFDEE